MPKQIKAFNHVFDTTYDLTHHRGVAAYVAMYINCEVAAQALIKQHKKQRGKKVPVRLYLPNILKAVTALKIPISQAVIFEIFPGGEGLRHHKSPRQLRNAYVHKKHPMDALEMLKHYDAHTKVMTAFLTSIKQTMLSSKKSQG